MTKRIQNAIDVLLDAINNGTLAKGDCRACAVGNLVAAGQGGVINKAFECTTANDRWGRLFATTRGVQDFYKKYLEDICIQENIQATRFNAEELAAIEFAFETKTKILLWDYKNYAVAQIKADQIKDLEAVIKVMLTFDDIEADIKEVFTSKVVLETV